jgi:hypothetical protein
LTDEQRREQAEKFIMNIAKNFDMFGDEDDEDDDEENGKKVEPVKNSEN